MTSLDAIERDKLHAVLAEMRDDDSVTAPLANIRSALNTGDFDGWIGDEELAFLAYWAQRLISRGLERPNADAEQLARRFHETYERLAPDFGYETRPESAVPWEQVPEKNRALMVAVVREVLASLVAAVTDAQRQRDEALNVERAAREVVALLDGRGPGHWRYAGKKITDEAATPLLSLNGYLNDLEAARRGIGLAAGRGGGVAAPTDKEQA